jgi:hypothetical protein
VRDGQAVDCDALVLDDVIHNVTVQVRQSLMGRHLYRHQLNVLRSRECLQESLCRMQLACTLMSIDDIGAEWLLQR